MAQTAESGGSNSAERHFHNSGAGGNRRAPVDLIPAAFCRICRAYHTKSRGIIFRTVSAVGEGAQGRTGCIPEKEKETVSCMEYRRCCRGFWCGFSVLVSCGVKYKFLGVMFSFAFLIENMFDLTYLKKYNKKNGWYVNWAL